MKKFGIFAIVLLTGAIIFGNSSAYAQIRQTGERVKFFNSGSLTLKNAAILQPDTAWDMLFNSALDTLKRVWVIDTSGRAQYGYGSATTYWKGANHGDSIKGVFTDSLHTKKGQAFLVKVIAHTTVTADTVILYGRNLIDPFNSFSADSARIDSITPATAAGKESKYVWTKLDSLQIRTSPAGTDCVRVLIRSYAAAVMADSNEAYVAGVLYGRTPYKAATTSDSVAADSFGYMTISGDVQVYMSGAINSRAIEVGDLLTVGTYGKAIRAYIPQMDTVVASANPHRKYLQGARRQDPVITQRSNRYAASANGDSVIWVGGVTFWNDSLIFIAVSTTGAAAAAAATDTLSYFWMPKGYLSLWPQVVVGRSLEKVWLDSTKAWMRLEKK